MQKYTLSTVGSLKGEIKLLALDLDGTLLDSHREISPRNQQALRQASAQGLLIAITTGRHPKSVLRYASALGTEQGSYAVIFNGSGVISLDEYRRHPEDQGFALLNSHSCSGLEAAWIFREAQKFGLSMHGYSVEQGLLVQALNPYSQREIDHNKVSYRQVDFASLDDSVHFFKILCTGQGQALDSFRASLPQQLSLKFEIMRSNPYFLEFIPDRSSKGTALCELCAHLNLPLSAVMAFGDAENDLTMLKVAGCGVAMQNALQPEILEISDLITLSNDEDGVAAVVEQIL